MSKGGEIVSLKVWNYSRGYVIIKVEGFSKERFLNLVVNKNIYVWDIQQKHNCLYMKVSVKGYKELKPLWRKANVKVKIIEKVGAPFFTYRYRRRKVIFIGVIIFVMSLYILSNFVWKINISGNERISTEEIVNVLESNDYKIGRLKSGFSAPQVESLLLKQFSDFSWVSLRKKGTTIEIVISENIEKKELIDRNTPCDIVAKFDGIIDSIATSQGDAVVGIGDVVKKGDILVKSEVYLREDEFGKHYTYVHAEADIIARTYVPVEFTVPREVKVTKYTGKSDTDYSISIFGKNIMLGIPFFDKKYNTSVDYTEMSQLKFGEDYPLPIILVKNIQIETEYEKKVLTENEMITLANRTIASKIIGDLNFETDVIDKKIEYIEADEGLKVSGYLIVLEEIDEKRELETKSINVDTLEKDKVTDN